MEGICEAVDNLNYRPGSVKYKAIKAIQSFYTSEESINTLYQIDTDVLIGMIWDVDGSPSRLKSKRRNFSSVKSSINADFAKLAKKQLNPDNIIVAESNIFDMTEEAKTSLLHSFTDAVKTGDIDIGKATDILRAITEFLDTVEMERQSDGSMDIINEIKKVLARMDGQLFDDEAADEDIETIELDEDEEIEEIELDEDEEIEEIYDDEEIEEGEALEDLEDVEEIGDDTEVEELAPDEEIEEIDEADEFEEIEDDEEIEEIEDDLEIEELDDDLEIEEVDEDQDIEEIDEDDELEEIDADAEIEDLDEDVDIEEVDADGDIEDVEEVDGEDLIDEPLGDGELEAFDEDAEIEEIDEDQEIEELDEDEDELEEIEELDEDEEIQEIDLEEDEELEDIDELSEDELRALEEYRQQRDMAEHFDDTLGDREKKFNAYVIIPKGTYTIGTQKSHKLSLALQPFEMPQIYMGKYPVTNSLFEIFIEQTGYVTTAEKKGYGVVYFARFEKNSGKVAFHKQAGSKDVQGACWYQPGGPGTGLHGKRNHPVVQVSVDDALAYASWIGRRLPSEAEWEAAARTDLGLNYPWGPTFNPKALNVETSGFSDTSPVDEFDRFANEFGLVDMLGNVMEWTSDREYPPFKTRKKEKYNVARGGGWNAVESLAISSRGLYKKDFTANTIGFRCVSERFQ